MSGSLLAISLGPVQDFIASARKTRDLWFGSAMLSDLSRAAARALHDAGATLIFPSPESVQGTAAVANKLLATTDRDPAALVDVARQAAQRHLERLAEQALERRRNLVVDEPLLRRQLDGFLEFYAAWVPASAGDYAADRAKVERLLAGRKALRDFRPAQGRPGVPKSSLDPSRESVLDWRGWNRSLKPPAGTRIVEQLDGISLIKRLAPARRFVSVSRVAVDPLVRRLESAEPATLARLRQIAGRLAATDAAEGFSGVDQFEAFPFDTELWYGEDERAAARPAEAEDFRQTLLAARGRLRLPEPPAYYAVLAADGDHMGALIAGLDRISAHQDLSRRLVEFAAEAEQIVTRHQGALVYSGGDDVLALLPLDRALACADALRRAFCGRIHGSDGTPATLTVGLALAHYLQPMTDVLDWARAAEAVGKQQGRNALTVALHTRSGGAATVATASWAQDPAGSRWNRWIELQRARALPGRAAYELRALATELGALGGPAGELVRAEAERVLTRRRQPHSRTPLVREHVQELLRSLDGREDAPAALQGVAGELIIARRMAEVVDLASTGGAPDDGHTP